MPYATEDDFDPEPAFDGGGEDHYATEDDFDPVDQVPIEYDPDPRGFGERLWGNTARFGLDAASGVAGGYAGLTRALEENLGTGTGYGEELARRAENTRRYARENFPIYSRAGETISDIGSGIAPAIVTGPLAPYFIGGQTGGHTYERLRERDVPPIEAAYGAGASGTAAGLASSLTLPRYLSGNRFAQFIEAPFLNVAGGAGQRATDLAVNARALGEVPPPEEISDEFGTGAKIDLLTGLGFGAAGRIAGARGRRQAAEQAKSDAAVQEALERMRAVAEAQGEAPPLGDDAEYQDAVNRGIFGVPEPLGLPYIPGDVVPNISGEQGPPIELGVSRGTRQFPEPPLPERAPFPDQGRTIDVIPPAPGDPRLVQSQPDITDPLALEVLRSSARTPEEQAQADALLRELRRRGGIERPLIGPTLPVEEGGAQRPGRTPEEQARVDRTLAAVRAGVPDVRVTEGAAFPESPVIDVVPPRDPRLVQAQPEPAPQGIQEILSSARTPEEQAAVMQLLDDMRRGIPPRQMVGPIPPVEALRPSSARTPEEQAQMQALGDVPPLERRIVDPQYRPREVVPITREGRNINEPLPPKTRLPQATLIGEAPGSFPESPARPAAGEPPAPQVPNSDLLLPQDERFRDFLRRFNTNERGSFHLPKTPAGRKAQALFDHAFRPEGAEIPGVERVELDPADRWLRNAVRKGFALPSTKAGQYPEAREALDTARQHQKTNSAIVHDLSDSLAPYNKLSDADQKAVNVVAIAKSELARSGQPFEETRANLKAAGLTDPQVDGYLAFRRTNEEIIEVMRRAKITQAQEHIDEPAKYTKQLAEINNFFDEMKVKNYIPRSRFGDYFVEGLDKKGGTVYSSFHDTKGQMRDAAQRLLKERPDLKLRSGRNQRPSQEAYDRLPTPLVQALGSLDQQAITKLAGKIPPRGVQKHFIEANFTPGYENDLGRSMAEYIQGAARFAAHAESGPRFQKVLDSLPNNTKRYDDISKYIRDQQSSSDNSKAAKLNQITTIYTLGGRVPSAVANAVGGHTMIWSKLGNYAGPAESARLMKKSMGEAYDFHYNAKESQAKRPELHAAIKEAVRTGVIDDSTLKSISSRRSGKTEAQLNKPSTWAPQDLLWMFGKMEKINRIDAFVSGWNVADRQTKVDPATGKSTKLTPAEKSAFAEQFVYETQFDQSKANRPELARGPAAPAFLFRLYAGNWLRQLRNEGALSPVGRRMLFTTLATGGVRAIPFAGMAFGAAQALGYDPIRSIRELVGNDVTPLDDMLGKGTTSGLVTSGIPYAGGIDMSRSFAAFDVAPEFEAGPWAAAGRFIGGAHIEPLNSLYRAGKYAQSGQYGRALESALPTGLGRDALAGLRGANEGWRTFKGTPLVEDVTPAEAIEKALGFTPRRLSDAYQTENSLYLLQQNAQAAREGLSDRIARARVSKDKGELASIEEYIREYNRENRSNPIKKNEPAIRQKMQEIQGSTKARLKRFPKGDRKEAERILRNYQ